MLPKIQGFKLIKPKIENCHYNKKHMLHIVLLAQPPDMQSILLVAK
jgi:hypothetical protein